MAGPEDNDKDKALNDAAAGGDQDGGDKGGKVDNQDGGKVDDRVDDKGGGDGGDAGDGGDGGDKGGDGDKGVKAPDDNADKSNLGRKVKFLENTVTSMASKIDQLLDSQLRNQNQGGGDGDAEIDNGELPQTPGELRTYVDSRLAARDEAQRKAADNYNSKYLATFGEFKDDEDFEEICKVVNEKFNNVHSDDPQADARINYLRASTDYYRTKAGTPTNPLKGRTDDLPLGSGGGDNQIDNQEQVPKLDATAQEYAAKVGLSDETIKKAMTGELPMGLRGKVTQ